jgi:hypothetical protein
MHRAKIDDLGRAAAVDHDVFRPQVLVQHLLAVKGLQPLGDLFDQGCAPVQVGRGWSIIHCARVRPSTVLHGHVQVLRGRSLARA